MAVVLFCIVVWLSCYGKIYVCRYIYIIREAMVVLLH